MGIGLTGKAFVNLLFLMLGVYLAIYTLLFFYAKKRGVDIMNRKFVYKLAFSCAFVCFILPMWFTDMTVKWKIISTILMIGIPLANALSFDRYSDWLHGKGGKRPHVGKHRGRWFKVKLLLTILKNGRYS